MNTQALLLLAGLCSQSVLGQPGYTQNNHGYNQNNQGYNTPYHGPLAKPVVLKSGYLADTHEVAAAKTAHQAAQEKLSHNNEDNHRYTEENHGYTQNNQGYTENNHGYTQNNQGYTENTHGYTQNNQEYTQNNQGFNQGQHHSAPYHGPLAKPVVLKSGYLADTHEVAAAKTTHHAALEKLSHNNEDNHDYTHDNHGHTEDNHGYTHDNQGYTENNHGYTQNNQGYTENTHGYTQNNQDYTQNNQGFSQGQHHDTPYHGPLAKPVVLKSGYLADTHEVAAAKTAHHAALEKLSHNNEDNHGYTNNNQGYTQNNHGYTQNNHGYTQNQQEYTQNNQGYTNNNQGYTQDNHGYTQNNHGYTQNQQEYTQNNQGYTNNNQGYTQDNHGYTQNNQGYNRDQHYNSPYHGPLAKPVVLKSGYLADTNEVAAAKTAHQAAPEKLSHNNEYNHGYTQDNHGHTEDNHGYTQNHQEYTQNNHGYTQNNQWYNQDEHYNTPYHGPLAKPVVLKSGYLADTHEVAAAKTAHHAALEKLSHNNEYNHGYTQDNHGHTEDNHGYTQNHQEYTQNNHGYTQNNQWYNQDEHYNTPYHGPLAKPVVLKSGYLADTHEVAAAKTAHHAALEKLSHNNEYNHDNTQDNHGHTEDNHGYTQHHQEYTQNNHGYTQNNQWYTQNNQDQHYNTPYHGPLAKPVVLKSGYLADTHEVAAAKNAHEAAALEKLPHSNEDNHGYTQNQHNETPYHDVAAAKEHHLHAQHQPNYHGHYL